MEYLPYTYLIGWSRLHTFYYGCEYSKNAKRVAHPSNLWSSYFTSSKQVKAFREEHGEPDIIQIRKTFIDAKSTRLWESKVLDRLKVTKKTYFLNKRGGSWKWAIYEMTDEVKNKISVSHIGKKMSRDSIEKRLDTLKVKGYAVSDSTRDKISESGKGVPQPASFVEKMKNKIWITDGIITKRIFSNEMIPEGWVKGRPYHWQNVRNILYIVKDTQSNQEELITRQDFLKRVGIVSSSVGCPKFQETIKYKNWLITRVSP